MYKYGVPAGVDPKELRKKIEKISGQFDKTRKDPRFQQRVKMSAKVSGRLSVSDLKKQFTV
jgi:hypothetical protein